MKNSWKLWSVSLFISSIILVVAYIDNVLSNSENYDGEELDEYYSIVVPDIDYSTVPYKLDLHLNFYEVTMPLHTDKILLKEAEKEKYLLKDYSGDFYFGTLVFKQPFYSLIEIYPEDRVYPFYYYEVYNEADIMDSGIIDRSSGVEIFKLLDLVWLRFGYGSNDNYVRFFDLGRQPRISEIIETPSIYDVYTDFSFYNISDKNLLAYYTYNENKEICIKVIDLFNDEVDIIINRDFTEISGISNVLKFLNSEEVYIEYQIYDLEHETSALVKEIVDFKDNVSVYRIESIEK